MPIKKGRLYCKCGKLLSRNANYHYSVVCPRCGKEYDSNECWYTDGKIREGKIRRNYYTV